MTTAVVLASALWAWADPPDQSRTPSGAIELVSVLESALAEAIDRAEPSVVAIAREKSENGETTAVRGRNQEPTHRDPRLLGGRRLPIIADVVSFDFGSGVVIGEQGEILTAFHVVRGARRLEVRAAGNQRFEAEVIASDPRSDLAVIMPRELPGFPPPKLKPIALGDATKLRKGLFLIAFGNSFNAARDGSPSASWGILANVARRLIPADEDRRTREIQLRHYPTLLQLDSKLNLGMGGGAVINLKGELVGITTAAASAAAFDAQAGYAIPLDTMGRRAVEQLRQGKEVEYGFLGISLDEEGTNRIASAQPGTPAAEGGLQTDDSVLAVNDRPINDAEGLMLAINTLPAGARVHLKILRHGETLSKTVELAKFPTAGEVIATNRPSTWRGMRVDHLSMMPDAPFGPALLSTMALGGVAVVEVESDSAAEKAGVRRGQVITHVAGRKVHGPREFAQAVSGLNGPVTLQTDSGPVVIK